MTIETPLGAFALRPERPGDAAFLSRLFHEAHAPQLRLGGLPESLIERLIAIQHRSQRETYHGQFPDAAFSIIVWKGEDIGRIVLDGRAGAVHVVDIVLRDDRRGQGLAAALLVALQRKWRQAGQRATATVAVTNGPSRRLWRKLGFVECALDAVNLTVVWTA